MGRSNGRESCGRCSFTTVIDVAGSDGDASDENERNEPSEEPVTPRHDPFEGEYIEVDERELRLVSAPAILAGRVSRWLDETADRLIHGR